MATFGLDLVSPALVASRPPRRLLAGARPADGALFRRNRGRAARRAGGRAVVAALLRLARRVGPPLYRLGLRGARLPGLLRRGADRGRGGARRPAAHRRARRHRRLSRAGRRPSRPNAGAVTGRLELHLHLLAATAGRTARGARRPRCGRPLRGAELSGEPFELGVDDAEPAQMIAGVEHVFGVGT